MFEEWLEGIKEEYFEPQEDPVFESLIREAYKLGLQRGFASAVDSNLYGEVSAELRQLDQETNEVS